MSLDLDEGDEELANASPRERRAAARRAAAIERNTRKEGNSRTSSTKRAKDRAGERVEAELTSRLSRTFDRIAKALEAREDYELASAIREDSEAMSQGLVSLTTNVKLLRSPLLMSLNLIEPVLAFGRVFRILFGRWNARQTRIAMEREEAQREASSAVPPQ